MIFFKDGGGGVTFVSLQYNNFGNITGFSTMVLVRKNSDKRFFSSGEERGEEWMYLHFFKHISVDSY